MSIDPLKSAAAKERLVMTAIHSVFSDTGPFDPHGLKETMSQRLEVVYEQFTNPECKQQAEKLMQGIPLLLEIRDLTKKFSGKDRPPLEKILCSAGRNFLSIASEQMAACVRFILAVEATGSDPASADDLTRLAVSGIANHLALMKETILIISKYEKTQP